jgi:hypothetical protein
MNIFEYKGYYQDFLNTIGVDLKKPYTVASKVSLNLDHTALIDYFSTDSKVKQTKYYMPRPFHPDADMRQATCLMHLGYNEHNSTETNIGLDEKDNQTLKAIIGVDNFKKLGLDPDTCLVRLLEYTPGNGIPLHTDSFNAFKNKYGQYDRRITRYFVAVSPWDWGHILQVHDKVIANWEVGDSYEIPEGIYHLSCNFGIAPKYSLTVTGFIND